MPSKTTEKKVTTRKPAKKTAGTPPAQAPFHVSNNTERLFALDIGTRSVIGIVAEREDNGPLHILATKRLEHKTRAMLDGQIHDVPQVASIISEIKSSLEKTTGPLSEAAVAAAGRALYTMTADAELEVSGIITVEQERQLDFMGVQTAQAKLSASETVEDPASYFCVGYSTIKYLLDGIQLKSLVGQRGHVAQATVIATFLPRQVIDSMISALRAADLNMKALTLEPIAAINVLIPPTMRHLNLVLVDIGAGTSDVAITNNGSVIAYGMVPLAGDEITEAISQKFLLDFNVAEQVKRAASAGNDVVFSDILGVEYDLSPKEVIEPIIPSIKNLAMAIAKQIVELNGGEPQAVLLVGGGSLTPNLAGFVAEALNLPEGHVAVRCPEYLEDMEDIPEDLSTPDAVTPLGILKIASINTLHFFTIYVNDEQYNLFNFRNLTISDALLSAGIQLKKFNGHPGLGIMINVEGQPRFIPGTMGTLAVLSLNGEEADLNTQIMDGDRISIRPGQDGTTPQITFGEVIGKNEDGGTIFINGRERTLPPQYLLNGEPAERTRRLVDGDVISMKKTRSLGESLKAAGYPPQGTKITYKLNGKTTSYTQSPYLLLNDQPTTISASIQDGDRIEYITPGEPKLSDVLNISDSDAYNIIYFNKAEHKIPSATITLKVNDRPASPSTIISEGCSVTYERSERKTNLVSDALLAVGFTPPSAASKVRVTILINNKKAELTDPIKNGDALDIDIQPIDKPAAPAAPALKDSLLGNNK